MRARFIAIIVLLVAASAASADDHLTLFLNSLGSSNSEWTGAGGISLDHAWNARWSTEASVALERRYRFHGVFLDAGNGMTAPAMVRDRVDTYPMDLLMRFHFPNDTRWTPYIALGGHYVAAPSITDFSTGRGIFPGPITLIHYNDRFGGEFGAGTTFRITPHVGLQFDLKQQLRLHPEFFDPVSRGSIGVNWKW